MTSELRVGIIGANARGGWAGEAHVPAVRALDGATLAAVATNRQETADEAADAFGVGKAYASGLALIADPEIDVVAVATRVPDHRELLLAASAAGKHVYSEWPLGRSEAEAGEIANAARAAGVRHAIGLQLRGSPAVREAKQVLASGTLGRILSVRVLSTTAGFGFDVPPQSAYLEDPASFANLVTIQGAHTLDLLISLCGPPDVVSTLASRQFPTVAVGEPPRMRQRRTFDHLLMQGRLGSGAPFALEVAGGRTGETPFRLDITGEKGSLRLDGGAPRGLQSSRVGLSVNGERRSVEEGGFASLADGAVNVAGVYRALIDDIRHGTSTVTDFDHARRLTRLVEDALQASEAGGRIRDEGNWPSG